MYLTFLILTTDYSIVDANINFFLLGNTIYRCIFTQAGYYGYVTSYFLLQQTHADINTLFINDIEGHVNLRGCIYSKNKIRSISIKTNQYDLCNG